MCERQAVVGVCILVLFWFVMCFLVVRFGPATRVLSFIRWFQHELLKGRSEDILVLGYVWKSQ